MWDLSGALADWAAASPALAPALFVFVRAVAIVIPPVIGLPLDLAAVSLFGWKRGFVLAEAGIMLGASVSFLLGRSAVRWVPDEHVLKLSGSGSTLDSVLGRGRFWPLMLLRLLTNPAFDFISYAAGASRVSFPVFFWATLFGNAPSVFLTFYLGRDIPPTVVWAFVILALLFVLMQILRSRPTSGQGLGKE